MPVFFFLTVHGAVPLYGLVVEDVGILLPEAEHRPEQGGHADGEPDDHLAVRSRIWNRGRKLLKLERRNRPIMNPLCTFLDFTVAGLAIE